MKRLAVLIAVASVLTACSPGALPAPEVSPAPAPVVEPAPPAPTPEVAPAPVVEVSPPIPVAAEPPPPPAPDAAPAPEAPRSTTLKNLVQVPAPALADLPQSYRDVLMQRSPWEVALNAAHWYHGTQVLEGPFLAPGLEAKLKPQDGAPARIWVKLIKSWEDGPGRFSFNLQVTAERKDGALYQAGLDVIETTLVKDGGPVVTGYAHAPATAAPDTGSVSVWVNTGGIPTQIALSHPVVDSQLPLTVIKEIAKTQSLGADRYAIDLGYGTLSEPLQAKLIQGVPYVSIADLVRVLDGQSASSIEGAFRYGARWRPDLRQLLLSREHTYPIS